MKWAVLLLALPLSGCAGHRMTSYELGAQAGRTFADADILREGSTAWMVTGKMHFDVKEGR